MLRALLFLSLAGLLNCASRAQNASASLDVRISVESALATEVRPQGRLLLHLRDASGMTQKFGLPVKGLEIGPISVGNSEKWSASGQATLSSLPQGSYTIWAEYDQKRYPITDAWPNALKSAEKAVQINGNESVSLVLNKAVREPTLEETDLLKAFSMRSAALSAFHGKEVMVKAGILLPASYAANPNKRYPVRYNVAGYGGRWTRVQRLVKEQSFMDWYQSEDGPEIISVYLDSDGPYGDNYQLNSDNSGPFGDALINELLPTIEQEYHVLPGAKNRFVDGCSTGGWVSLALQTLYPDEFGACYSYSPDPVSFTRMQLVNMYEDDNAFYNKAGYVRPSRRDIYGEPNLSIKQEFTDENVDGGNGTYTTSRGQWGAWNALYSGKGTDGLPKQAFDPVTGTIDKSVVEEWRRYDLLQHTKVNWPTLGPKLAGKVYVWMGDMDNYYLNNALREYDAMLKQQTQPISNALIEFTPMEGHCSLYSTRKVLEQISTRLSTR